MFNRSVDGITRKFRKIIKELEAVEKRQLQRAVDFQRQKARLSQLQTIATNEAEKANRVRTRISALLD